MNKKLYVSPDFEILWVEINDVILASVEGYKSYVDPEPGDWGDAAAYYDDEIDW